MRRPELPRRVAPRRGLSTLLCGLVTACGTPDATPSGRQGGSAADRPVTLVQNPERAQPRDPASPFRRPSEDPPPPRSEPQVTDAELAELLATATSLETSGDRNGAILALRKCANRVPASAVCEGRLGMLLEGITLRRAERRYYLAEAARTDDPRADASFYTALGGALSRDGLFEDAATALQRAIDRGATTAADYHRLAIALQGIPGRQLEAADTLATAFRLDPSQIEWLYDEGVLRGQIVAEASRAAELLREYLSRDRGRTRPAARVETRIAELEAIAAMPPPPPEAPTPEAPAAPAPPATP